MPAIRNGVSSADHASQFPCCSKKTKTLFVALTVILALGALAACGIGIATLGVSHGWWTLSGSSLLTNMSQTYAYLLAIGGGVTGASLILTSGYLLLTLSRPNQSPVSSEVHASFGGNATEGASEQTASATDSSHSLTVSPTDLDRVRTCVSSNRLRLHLGEDSYIVWYNSSHQALCFQAQSDYDVRSSRNKLSVNLDSEGGITNIWVDGSNQNNVVIPANWVPIFGGAVTQLIQLASSPSSAAASQGGAASGEASEQASAANAQHSLTVSPNQVGGGAAGGSASGGAEEAVEHFALTDLCLFRSTLKSLAEKRLLEDGERYGFDRNRHDINTFKNSDLNETVTDDDGNIYRIWYNPGFGSINIQAEADYSAFSKQNKLGVSIAEEGTIQSVYVDGEATDSNEIPEEWKATVEKCLIRALQLSSHYASVGQVSPTIQVRLVRGGVSRIPLFHLDKLSRLLVQGFRRTSTIKLSIVFMDVHLAAGTGIDAGGLTRDYVSELMSGLLGSSELHFSDPVESGGVLPVTKETYTGPDEFTADTVLNSIPALGVEEQKVYSQLGHLMMACYHSQGVNAGHFDSSFITGRAFSEALFYAICQLKAADLRTEFRRLGNGTLFKMCAALDVFLGGHYQTLIAVASTPSPTQDQLASALALLKDTYYIFDEDSQPEVNSSEGKAIIKIAAEAVVLERYGAMLAPIHALAGGMRTGVAFGVSNESDLSTRWDAFTNATDPTELSKKIQGTLDREMIARYIQLNSGLAGTQREEIQKKVDWLKRWIQEESTTDEEVKSFLKYATGTPSLAEGKQITANEQYDPYSPCPKAHSCSFELEFAPHPCGFADGPNDRTYEAFVVVLKAALNDAGAYSTA